MFRPTQTIVPPGYDGRFAGSRPHTQCTADSCEIGLADGIHLCHTHTTRLEEALRQVPDVWANIHTTACKLDVGAPVPIEQLTLDHDWASPLGERVAAPLTYARPLENQVLYVQNSNDFSHMADHYKPFREAVEAGPNASRVRFDFYDGPNAHVAQNQEVMDRGLAAAVALARS